MLENVRSVFIVGIKGVAMANIALILKQMGKSVTGSDVKEEFITDELLNDQKISFIIGFEAKDLPQDTDLVVYSAAHKGDNNPQVKEAKKRKIKTLHQAQLINEIMKGVTHRIAVCGSHGKTTTSSFLAHCLNKLLAGTSYLVGTPSFGGQWGGNYTNSDYFIVEADEYAVNPPKDMTPKFSFLDPTAILANNIDLDHPDVYRDIDQIKTAFKKFFTGKKLFLCADDEELMSVAADFPNGYVSFGFAPEAELKISNVKTDEESTTFDLSWKNKACGQFRTSLFGRKNVSNLAGAIFILLKLGFNTNEIKESMQGFSGVKRRFEKKAKNNNIFLFDDYAHHPKEISAVVSAARMRFPKRRIILIFQPHTYSRTNMLKEDFSTALSQADYSLVAPIFPSARENPDDFKISSFDIAKGENKNVIAFSNNKELLANLETVIEKGDVIFTMGAGDIYKLENDIIEIIKSKS